MASRSFKVQGSSVQRSTQRVQIVQVVQPLRSVQDVIPIAAVQSLTFNKEERAVRDDRWSEAIAVGSLAFVESVKSKLGTKAIHRAVERIDRAYALREESEAYDGDLGIESAPLSLLGQKC